MTPRLESIQVIGHAGAAGFHPHNSAASIRKAIELGVSRIEVDLLVTSDRVLVLLHDTYIVVEGIRRPLAGLTAEQARGFSPDTLSLDEALEIVAGQIPLLLDIKGRGYERELVQVVRRIRQTGSVSASSTHARALRKLHRAFPDMTLGLSRGHSLFRIRNLRIRRVIGVILSVLQIVPLLSQAKWCGARELMINHHICTSWLVWAAHVFSFKVGAWTVDEPGDIERVIGTGVDFITSNRPDRVYAQLEDRPA